MKKLLFFTLITSMSVILLTACDKDEISNYDFPISEQLYFYGPELEVEIHDEQGTDLIEKYKYVKYPYSSLEDYVDGFNFVYYLNGKLVAEEKNVSLLVTTSEHEITTDFERPAYTGVKFSSADVFELTKDNAVGPHEVKIEFSNDLLFPSSGVHTLTYTFTREPREDYVERETDKYCPLWELYPPKYTNAKCDGQPLEIKVDRLAQKKRVDIVVK